MFSPTPKYSLLPIAGILRSFICLLEIIGLLDRIRCLLGHPLTDNRGNPGDEILDDQFNFANSRRRSNSSGFHNIQDLKTKFEVNEPEPVFEETIHGPTDDELTKTESSSTSGGSVDEVSTKSV